MARLLLLLCCCCCCVVSVIPFLPGPWTVLVFDDVGRDAPIDYYTPFMETRSRGLVDNGRRRPQLPGINRPPPGRIHPNNLYPPRRDFVATPDTAKYLSPYVSSPYCPVGQQYVYQPPGRPRDSVASICPLNNPIRRLCRCLTGCRHKNFFIPYGTSITVDKCGNKCYCNNQNGEVECQFDSC